MNAERTVELLETTFQKLEIKDQVRNIIADRAAVNRKYRIAYGHPIVNVYKVFKMKFCVNFNCYS